MQILCRLDKGWIITIKINNYKSATASKARSPHIALVAAAGKGTRMGAEIPKQLMSYKGMTVVERTASVFAAHEEIDAVFLLIPQDREYDETFFQIADRLERLSASLSAVRMVEVPEESQFSMGSKLFRITYLRTVKLIIATP